MVFLERNFKVFKLLAVVFVAVNVSLWLEICKEKSFGRNGTIETFALITLINV